MGYRKGIDVSYHQGTINWPEVKAAGIEFAMLRAGYGKGNVDAKFHEYAGECTRLGIPFGVYWFSYAYTEAMAAAEAQYCLDTIAPYKLSYPIAFDFEYDSVNYAQKQGVTASKALASAMARAFLNAIEAAGHYAAIYANPDYLNRYFDADIPPRYDVWLAQWPDNPNFDSPPAKAGGMWQYTSSGSVKGINGRVDLDIAYHDYPSLIGQPAEPAPAPEKTEAELAREWAMAQGITDGSSPDADATREQIWIMMYRQAKSEEENK